MVGLRPVGKGGAQAHQLGLAPAGHLAKGGVHIGNAAFHVERANRRASIFKHVAGSATDANFCQHGENNIFGRYARPKGAVNADFASTRLTLQQALRGQHMTYFAGADAEAQRTKSTMRRSMAVTTHDSHAWLSKALFWSNDVHNTPLHRIQTIDPYTVGQRISLE